MRPATRVVIPGPLRDRLIKKTLTLAEVTSETLIAGEGRKAGLTNEEMAPQLAQTKLGEDNKEIIAELTPYILQEWGVDDPEISPTLAAGLILGPWTLGCATAYLTLASLAKEKLEMEKAKKKATETESK